MIDQRKRIFAVNLWLFDLLLTAVSFFWPTAFVRCFELEGHTVMPVQSIPLALGNHSSNLGDLAAIFRVYSEPATAAAGIKL